MILASESYTYIRLFAKNIKGVNIDKFDREMIRRNNTAEIVKFAKEQNVDLIVGPEARGFIFGCPVSYAMGIGFVPVRKPKNYLERL